MLIPICIVICFVYKCTTVLPDRDGDDSTHTRVRIFDNRHAGGEAGLTWGRSELVMRAACGGGPICADDLCVFR